MNQTKEKEILLERYERISNNIHFDKKLQPYKEKNYKDLISFFSEIEDYEKCHEIQSKMNERYGPSYNYLSKL